MHRNICSRSIAFVVATFLRVSLSTTIAIAVSSLASLGQVNSMERTTLSEEAPDQIVSDQEIMPLDAFGYLGGLFEARFYQPHSTTDDPRDEIREAASLYGLDLAMMMSIAKSILGCGLVDQIAFTIECEVALPLDVSVGLGRNDRSDSRLGESFDERIGVISFVANQGLWVGVLD
jgi:hypothetical protein